MRSVRGWVRCAVACWLGEARSAGRRGSAGAYAALKILQHELDQAVVACYGWPKAVAQDAPELVRRLTALNREIADGARRYDPFGSVAARCR